MLRCRDAAACSLTDRRSTAHSPVDGQRAPGEPLDPAELMEDINFRQAVMAMIQRHLISDPSKITDVTMVHQ